MRYIPRGYTKEDLRKMYLEQNMRREDIAKRYNISISCVDKDVQKYGFRKSKELISAQFEKKVDKNALYQYYIVENHTNDQTAQHFKIDERTLRRKMRKYGIIKSQEQQLEALKREQFQKYGTWFPSSEYYQKNVKDKMLNTMKITCMNKYGVEYTCLNHEVMSKSSQKYFYENEIFDSSWELALWIYAKDHQEPIIRNPCRFEYLLDNQIHYYYPDFEYKGILLEIKGDHLFNKDNKLQNVHKQHTRKDECKQRCMDENHIVVWKQAEVQFAINYVNQKYGKNYLKSFKKRSKRVLKN